MTPLTGPVSSPVSFPAQSEVVSPDGRYALSNVDSELDPHHTVFLEDRVRKTRRKLFNYGRHVVVLWNSESRLFAVTDFVGSDTSKCTVFSVDEKSAPLPVLDLLLRQLGEEEKRRLQSQLGNHHAYVEGWMWNAPRSLTLKVWGYGDNDPAGFTEFLDVPLEKP